MHPFFVKGSHVFYVQMKKIENKSTIPDHEIEALAECFLSSGSIMIARKGRRNLKNDKIGKRQNKKESQMT